MFKRLLISRKRDLLFFTKRLSSQSTTENVAKFEEFVKPEITEYKTPSVLEKCSEDISHVSTYLKPTFNFAAYVNKSETLQELVKLGVNLHHIETKNHKAVPYILGLNFDDIKEHIIFFHDLGLTTDVVSSIITKNPFIFQEDVKNLEIRVNYLKSKKFTDDNILRILSKNPFWLSNSTKEIDKKLGLFQKTFELNGDEVRLVATGKPKLITEDFEKVKLSLFVLKEEMGFTNDEAKKLLLNKPSIYLNGHHKLLQTFEYLHRDMGLSLERILEEPQILTCRMKRLKERYLFLKHLNRIQFNPKEPNYVSLITLVSGTDAEFATEIAKSSIQTYNMFIKSMM